MPQLALVLFVLIASQSAVSPSTPATSSGAPVESSPHPSLEDAQRFFYTGQYEAAANLAEKLAQSSSSPLAAYELRTSALHFLIKRQIGSAEDQSAAFKQCVPCADWLKAFMADFTVARTLAREKALAAPSDMETQFLLGKIDLNYVWLQLGTLGHKTGWNEYWEARHAMEAVLKQEPKNVRALVSFAWIEYIVDTRMPWGMRWVMGGGNKKRALAAARSAAAQPADFFVNTEARFALWEMLARDKDFKSALVVARTLVTDFPGNAELVRFINVHGQGAD